MTISENIGIEFCYFETLMLVIFAVTAFRLTAVLLRIRRVLFWYNLREAAKSFLHVGSECSLGLP